MSNTKKLTKREKFEMVAKIKEVAENPILAEFVAHELELLAKKNSADAKKLTATQVENERLKNVVVETLVAFGKKLTITELQKGNTELAELSNQKLSALIRQLVTDEKVIRTEEKRKAYFSIA